MNVLTVTLNPALDRVIEVDGFETNVLHRIFDPKKVHVSPGGKGVNVSVYLHQLGVESAALGIVGGFTGRTLHTRLQNLYPGISTSFLYIDGETREDITIIDKDGNSITEINLPGPDVGERHIDLFMKKYRALLSRVSVCSIGGTIPNGIPLGIYREMIEMAEEAGVTTIINAHGEPLNHALDARPTIVKPDLRGSKVILNRPLEGLEDYIAAGKKIIENGTKMVIFSYEIKNDIVITKDWIYVFTMKGEFRSVNLLGTGDAYIAGLVYGITKGKDFFESARYGMAAAIADELTEEKDLVGVENVNECLNLISMERILS